MTAYGADTMPGVHEVLPGPWTAEYQVARLEMSHRVFDRIDAVVGEQVWNFADFAVAVFRRARQPEAAGEVLCRRWRGHS